MEGTVNISELLINVVRFKRAIGDNFGSGQNGAEKGGSALRLRAARTEILPAERQDLTLPVIRAEHGKPVSAPIAGKPTARKAVGGAGMRSRSKRMPACSGSDTKMMLRPERVLTSEWSFVTRSLAEPFQRRKANGRGP